jgi:(p)ppGpp synthase/HD superfamily hydrolase
MGGEMTWRFNVVASVQERLLSRILQVLEVQRVNIQYFTGEMDGTGAKVTFAVSSEEEKAHRIAALLYCLEGIDQVSVSTESEVR